MNQSINQSVDQAFDTCRARRGEPSMEDSILVLGRALVGSLSSDSTERRLFQRMPANSLADAQAELLDTLSSYLGRTKRPPVTKKRDLNAGDVLEVERCHCVALSSVMMLDGAALHAAPTRGHNRSKN
mmetsp:Transcript_5244/g.11257  ORF Transcript_5244/g.11257 Transcript_5244/m.11257 type:complete len:128 (-) Transcript_5244:83-466(-)